MKKFLLFLCILTSIPSSLFADGIADSPKFKAAREKLVKFDIEGHGISDPQVLAAMRSVLRHGFVPKRIVTSAYADTALPIGEGQTISQPYVVALMTASLGLNRTQRVLEIGTGSGYQAAILSELVTKVYSIEIVEPLALESKEALQRLGYENVQVRAGDGNQGVCGAG